MDTKRLMLLGVLVLAFVFISVYHKWTGTYLSKSANEVILSSEIYRAENVTTTLQTKKKHNHSVVEPIKLGKVNFGQTKITLQNNSIAKKIKSTSLNETSYGSDSKINMDNEPSFINLPDRRMLHLTQRGIFELANRPAKAVTDKIFVERNLKIRQNCQQYRNENGLDLSRMIYDDKHKFIMCVVPKNGCTSWKRMVWYLLGYAKSKDDSDLVSLRELSLENGYFPVLSGLSKADAMERLLTYTSFVVMRNPYDRIVSAYSDKFSNISRSNSYKLKRGRSIARALALAYVEKYSGNTGRKDLSFLRQFVNEVPKSERKKYMEYVSAMKDGEISFDQFTEFLVTSPFPKRFDIHWRSQMDLCNPCAANYDVIVNFDDFGHESNKLLEYIQRNDSLDHQVRFDPMVKPKNSGNKVINYFNTLSSERIEKIRAIYKNDDSI